MTKCAVATCSRDVYAKGLCTPHYVRVHEKGDLREDEPLQLKNRPAWEKVLERVVIVGDCWQWPGATNRGYGIVKASGKSMYVHRVMYEHEVGPISEGLSLDHLCHTADKSCEGGFTCPHRRCANPAHLEPVTNLENSQRGRAGDAVRRRVAKLTHCPHGHEYTPENLRFYGPHCGRMCRECNRQRAAANRAKKKQT